MKSFVEHMPNTGKNRSRYSVHKPVSKRAFPDPQPSVVLHSTLPYLFAGRLPHTL